MKQSLKGPEEDLEQQEVDQEKTDSGTNGQPSSNTNTDDDEEM